MLTSLDAVNDMVSTANQTDRVVSPTWTGSWPSITYGNDIASRAKWVLDLYSHRVHLSGIERFWTPSVQVTSQDNKVEFGGDGPGPANVVRVRGAGPDRGRIFGVCRIGGEVLLKDLATNSTTFPTGQVVTIDYVQEVEFDSVDTMIQPLILDIAKYHFVQVYRSNDKELMLMLAQQADVARRTIASEVQAPLSGMGSSGYMTGPIVAGFQTQ